MLLKSSKFAASLISRSRLLVWAAVLTAIPLICEAQLPVARLFTIFPCGGQAGTNIEVEVAGQDLDDLRQLHFSSANLTAKHLDGNKFNVSITPGTPPGFYDVRAVGRFGISNPRVFAVCDFPETIAPSTNTALATAASVAIGTTVNGRAVSEAFQYFKFSASKGQRILVECEAENLDSRLAPSMTLVDAAGREVAGKHSSSLLDLQVATEGEYFVRLADTLYRGGSEYFYRLSISTNSHIDFVLPSAAAPRLQTKLTVFGRNLRGGTPSGLTIDGNPLDRLEVEVTPPAEQSGLALNNGSDSLKPSAVLMDGFDFRLGREKPYFLSFAKAAVVAEQEPANNKPETAPQISVPCELSGQFYPAGDRDWVQFEAKKGEVIWIEALSHRLGLPTDPFILIQRVSKKSDEPAVDVKELYESENPGGNEFKAASLDPSWRFEVSETATYRIEIRDLFTTSSDPRRLYRLSFRREEPDFKLVTIPQPMAPAKKDSKDATIVAPPFLRRGETMPLKVVALRQEGLKGAIDLTV